MSAGLGACVLVWVVFFAGFGPLQCRSSELKFRLLSCGKKDRAPHQACHAAMRFLKGFLEDSSKELLLRRVLRRHLVRISAFTRVLRRGTAIEGASKALTLSFFSLVFLFPWCFSSWGFPWSFGAFSA